MALRLLYLACLAASCALAATQATLQLQGHFEDVTTQLHVGLTGVESPFSTSTTSDSHGRFRFRSLQPATYVVSAFIRGHGLASRTVVLTPSLANASGIISVTIPLPPPTTPSQRARRRSTVSVAHLSVSDAARKKFDQAQKDLAHHNPTDATAHLQQAVQLSPKFTAAWNTLGVISYQSRDYAAAEQYFRKALEIEPDAWTPALNLGGVLLNLHKPEEALDYNRSAVQSHPNDALANSQLGLTYHQLNQPDRAEPYLATAERLDPSHFSHPQLVLAEIYAQRGDRGATLRELNDFIVRFPDNPASAELRKRLQSFAK